MRQACGVKSFVFTHRISQKVAQTYDCCSTQRKGDIHKPMIIVQQKEEETYGVASVLELEKRNTISVAQICCGGCQ
jgi:hypothetical protein